MVGLAFVFAAAWFCSTAMARIFRACCRSPARAWLRPWRRPRWSGRRSVGARVLEFWLMRHVHPIVSARIASLAHPVGAAGLIALGAPRHHPSP
jgi:hypothetical protein